MSERIAELAREQGALDLELAAKRIARLPLRKRLEEAGKTIASWIHGEECSAWIGEDQMDDDSAPRPDKCDCGMTDLRLLLGVKP